MPPKTTRKRKTTVKTNDEKEKTPSSSPIPKITKIKKEKLNNGFRSISVDKKKLQKALELLQPSVPLFYEDNVNLTRNCKPPIYTLKDQTIFTYLPDSLGKLFAQIQKAVQQSDWTNLVKLLHIIVQRNDSLFYYPVIKSTLICLLSDPLFRETKFLAKFLEAVVFCKDKEEMDLFIKRLLEFPINLQNLVCHTQLSRR